MSIQKAAQRYLAFKERIPGGLSSGKQPKDFDRAQLNKGIKVEMEHTTSRSIATEIAMDHLTEDPDYYRKLRRIEKSAENLDQQRALDNLINYLTKRLRDLEAQRPDIPQRPLLDVIADAISLLEKDATKSNTAFQKVLKQLLKNPEKTKEFWKALREWKSQN